tara:strand:+ start:1639 stop:1971 length:333 start_codon:yes stop_codon:yes gene_type:complete
MKEPVDTTELLKVLQQESRLSERLQQFINEPLQSKQTQTQTQTTDIVKSDEIDSECSFDDEDSLYSQSNHINQFATFFMNEHGNNICDVLTDINRNLSSLVSILQQTKSS